LVDLDAKAGRDGIDVSGAVHRDQDSSLGVVGQNLPNALTIGIEPMPNDSLRVV
jgi:hypothetical protein